MLYRVESKGLDRIVTGLIDQKYFNFILTDGELKFMLPLSIGTGYKKIELQFFNDNTNKSFVKFKLNKSIKDISVIEIIIDLGQQYLDNVFMPKQKINT